MKTVMGEPRTKMPDFEVRNVVVRFGGVVAIDDVSLHADAGVVTALIGPNGAGKTTMFNASTGVITPASGKVLLGGESLDQYGTARRAAKGLGRTFQRMELFNSMTVEENVRLGPEALLSSHRPFGQIVSGRHERAVIAERAEEAMERCDIVQLRKGIVGDLSTGQRRLVELARAIASPFRFLLLDEPSSGLDHLETEKFAQVLRDFVAVSGMGILLVEHDMALVSAICSYVFVLEFGRLIYRGSTAETMASDVVRRAYLGTDSADRADRDEALDV